MANGDKWIGVNEAARMLGVSAETVRRWADNGTLKARRTTRPAGWRQLLLSSVEQYQREMEGDPGADQ